MSQTNYDFDAPAAFAGQLGDLSPKHVRSSRNEETTAIPFGVAVKQGTGDDDVLLPDTATDEIIGITVHSHAHDSYTAGVADGVATKGSVDVLHGGTVFVQVEEAVAPGDQVFTRIADGVADATKTQKGAFRKSADTATAIRVRGARFLTTAAAGGFALVEFDSLANRALSTATADIEDDAVTTEKIAAGAVTTTELGADAVTAEKLADDAVVTANIVDANVTSEKIADAAVTVDKLALKATTGLVPLVALDVSIPAGVATGADDVDLGELGIKARIVDAQIVVGTAGTGGSTATLRDAAAGAGNALSDDLSTAATGRVRSDTLASVPTIAATDHLYVRRTDDSAAFTLVLLLAPLA